MKSIISLIALFISSAVFAGAFEELKPEDQKKVQNGEQVSYTQDDSSSAWPKITIYERIDSTPEEAAAVFTDYELQKTYIKNILKSKVVKTVDRATVQVAYALDASIMTEHYTVEDHVSAYDGNSSYRIDWNFIEADSTEDIVGHVRFERLGTATLMIYYNFVTPGSIFAGAVKNKAMQQVKDTAHAVREQVERERKENQALLQKQLQALRTALGR